MVLVDWEVLELWLDAEDHCDDVDGRCLGDSVDPQLVKGVQLCASSKYRFPPHLRCCPQDVPRYRDIPDESFSSHSLHKHIPTYVL